MEGQTENFIPRELLHLHPGDKIHPWGTTSPLGSKFRGEVKNGPLKIKQDDPFAL
jgi:hypothetical protein